MPTDPPHNVAGNLPLGPRVRGYLAPLLSDSAAWSALLDAPMPSAACDADGRLLFVNQAMLDLLSFPLDQLLPRAWLDVLFPEPAAKIDARGLIGEVLASQVTTRHRREVKCGDGRRLLLDLTSTAIKLPDGTMGAMTIAADMTGQSPPADTGERGYRELVEDAPDVLMRFDLEGRVLYVNRAIERFTGYAPAELYANPGRLYGTLDADAQRLWTQAFAQVVSGDARIFDLALQHRDGHSVILQLALYPIRDVDGRVRLIEGTARDLTTVRQLEQLKARNEERAALDRIKSELLANVSHELRTPLVSIKGYNELLLRGALGPLTPRQRRGLEIAGANTDRLIELIETLLDFARREEGRLELKHVRFDLREAVQDAIAALHDRIASRDLSLRLQLGPSPLAIRGDRARLAQVFRALIGNAEKFSDGQTGDIVVTARTTAEIIEVAVSDHGIGIPKEAQPKIFDRFYQVDASSTRRFGGAGLGLSMAKELVTLHGGEILVDSAPGSGSTFTVRLPRAEAEIKQEPSLQPVVMLVGADDPTWRNLRSMLEAGPLGPVDLFWASTEAEVARRARRHRPDVVLLAFAKVDALIDELKRDVETSNLPVVVVTDDGSRPLVRADLVADAHDPVRLQTALARLLGRAPSVAPQPRAPRVVIVEDELEILDFTRFVLEREGYDVVCLASGKEALEAVDGNTDLVVLDIALEDSDGLDLCRRLKSETVTREVPILIMTAMSGEDVRQGSLGAGADGYLMKPFGVDEFLRQVRLHLRRVDPATGPGVGPGSARESA